MNTYYLKADTEAELQAAMDAAGLNSGDESRPYFGQCGTYILVWIGTIGRPTGNLLAEGTDDERPELASLDGYHCNIHSNDDLPEALLPFQIPEPVNPVEKLSGS